MPTALRGWPSMAGWLTPDVPNLNKAIVFRCFHDVGICEIPIGSNRSGRIDEWNRRSHAPLGSYWCASWATAVWEDCGAAVPPASRASCDVIMDWAKKKGLWQSEPIVGGFVLYGVPGDAQHIGVTVRTAPLELSIEGNTSLGGYNRNGVAVDLKETATKRVLGYVHPIPAR